MPSEARKSESVFLDFICERITVRQGRNIDNFGQKITVFKRRHKLWQQNISRELPEKESEI